MQGVDKKGKKKSTQNRGLIITIVTLSERLLGRESKMASEPSSDSGFWEEQEAKEPRILSVGTRPPKWTWRGHEATW